MLPKLKPGAVQLNSLQQARNPKTFLRARRLADMWPRSRHRPCRLCTGGLFFFGPALMDGSKQSQLYMLPNLLRPKQTICLLSPRSKQLCPSSFSLSHAEEIHKELELGAPPWDRDRAAAWGATAATTTAEATPAAGWTPRGSSSP